MTNLIKMNKAVKSMEMNDRELAGIAGGNYGDTVSELNNGKTWYGVDFMYDFGDTVEVYNNFLHITTTRGKVVGIRVEPSPYNQNVPRAVYTVKFANGDTKDATADNIQSNTKRNFRFPTCI